MTEVTLHKKSFLATLDAFRTQFDVTDSPVTVETEPSGDRFMLAAKRPDGNDVRAYGPCEVKGEPVSVACNMTDLEAAIQNAHLDDTDEKLTLLIGDGIWVKDPRPANEED